MPLSEREKNAFSVFLFRKRHDFASARGTVVISSEARACLFRKGKKPVFPVQFFRQFFSSGFFVKKSSSKLINMGSSFEDLDARNPTVQAVRDLDARFKR